MRVTSGGLQVTGSTSQVTSSNLRVTSSNAQVTRSSLGVTSSNLEVTSLTAPVRKLKARWQDFAGLNARVEAIKPRVKLNIRVKSGNSKFKISNFTS